MSTVTHPASSREDFLTLKEAEAEGYGAYSTLRWWIDQGKLPAYKTGSRVKIKREDLDTFIVRSHGVDPLEAHVRAVVAEAPKLNDSQIHRLRFALGGGR